MAPTVSILQRIRQYKIGPFAYFDLITAFLGMYLLGLLIRYYFKIDIIINLLLLTLPIGIFVHILFGIETPLTEMFFDPNEKIVKIIMLFLTLSGFLYQ